MSCLRSFDRNGILNTEMAGTISKDDFSAVIDELSSYSGDANEVYEVVFYPEKTEVSVSRRDWMTFNHRIRHTLNKFNRGAVAYVSDDDLMFGLFRQQQALFEGDDVKLGVFRSKDQAYKWVKKLKLLNERVNQPN